MMDTTIYSSRRLGRAISSITTASGLLRTSPSLPGCGDRTNSPPALPGLITIAMASWTWLLPIMCNGPKRAISTAHWTARINRIARRNRTRERQRACGITWGTGSLKMLPRNPASAIPPPRAWEWRSSITTRMAGLARAGMGVDTGDYDRSGRPSLMITNFANQMISLYHNEGNGLFVDEAPRSEVGRNTLVTLGFGCFFFDYDNDGWPDILVADGHIENEIERVQKRVSYAEPPHLFRNLGGGRFKEVTEEVGSAFASPKVARGAAYAD